MDDKKLKKTLDKIVALERRSNKLLDKLVDNSGLRGIMEGVNMLDILTTRGGWAVVLIGIIRLGKEYRISMIINETAIDYKVDETGKCLNMVDAFDIVGVAK